MWDHAIHDIHLIIITLKWLFAVSFTGVTALMAAMFGQAQPAGNGNIMDNPTAFVGLSVSALICYIISKIIDRVMRRYEKLDREECKDLRLKYDFLEDKFNTLQIENYYYYDIVEWYRVKSIDGPTTEELQSMHERAIERYRKTRP